MDPESIVHRVPPNAVRPAHTDDYAIREFIEESKSETSCSYCDAESEEPIAVSLYDLVEFIEEAVRTEWNTADDEGLPYDSGEGGYQLATPLSSWELLAEETDLEPANDDELLQHLADGLSASGWVQKDFYALSPFDRLRLGYDWFAEELKHSRRYFFGPGPTEEEDSDTVSPADLLELIGRTAEGLGLVRELNDAIYRARPHAEGEQPDSARALGAPPVEFALSANRMSPAGISMFYGSLDAATAAAEAAGADPEESPAITVARFSALRPLRVLDLTELPEVPSAFDVARRDTRPQIAFLRHFVSKLREPVVRDRSEHVEYVPTQVVCEYLRSRFRCEDGNPVDGVLYSSVRHPGGTSLVLFADNDGARDVPGSVADKRREEEDRESILPPMWRHKAILQLEHWERAALSTPREVGWRRWCWWRR